MARTAMLGLASLLILTACTGNDQGGLPDADFFVSSGQIFLSRTGDTAGIVTQFSILLVSFNGVTEDSRCPEGVACIQAGHATISLGVQTTLDLQEVTLEVPPEGGVQIEVAGELLIEVLEVRPPAQDGVTIDLIDYQLLMRATQTGSPIPTTP